MSRLAAILTVLLVLGLSSEASGQPQDVRAAADLPPPVVLRGADGIFELFKSRPVVALADSHGVAQQYDFYNAIIRDPRFARDVGNVVIEFGTAQHQQVIDRYVNGEDVPYVEVRKVWTDVPGWSPFANFLGFANIYAQIRATNLTLPPGKRIKVWLGDPPIDWSKVKTQADWGRANAERGPHSAKVLVDNVLSKNRKALVIYGGAHLTPASPSPWSRTTPNRGTEAALRGFLDEARRGVINPEGMIPAFAEFARQPQGREILIGDLVDRGPARSVTFIGGDEWGRDLFEVAFRQGPTVRIPIRLDADGKIMEVNAASVETGVIRSIAEAAYPNSFHVVNLYTGSLRKDCADKVEQAFKDWPIPALAMAARDSALSEALYPPGCFTPLTPTFRFGPWVPKAEQEERQARLTAATRNPTIPENLLYLGPAATLLTSSVMPEFYLDPAYREEVTRRTEIRNGSRYRPVDMREYPTAQRPLHAYARLPAPPTPTPTQEARMAAFTASDADKDGRLDKFEYWEALKAVGLADQLEANFYRRDVNRDYFLSLEEYRPASAP